MYNYIYTLISGKICRINLHLAVTKCFDPCARVFLVLSAGMDAETGKYAAPVSAG